MICKEFGWDYYTYENQPYSFIEEICLILYQESQKQKLENAKAQARNK